MDQLKDVSRQAVFQIGYLPALLDFEPAVCYFLQLLRLPIKDIPHSDSTLSWLDCSFMVASHRTIRVVPSDG